MSVTSEVQLLLVSHEAGPLGAIALALALRLDDREESSPAQVAKELRATIEAIQSMPAKVQDPLDDLEAQREARRQAAAAKPKRVRKPRAKSS